ncbi:hypothetical protein HGM15179_001323 [Zosterops borbonicus]|uniref:Uncharacterized protein n=1 Tax=Zosterops borbonicus TaxID=364589 RepID=A0A8K1GVT5_9PASS|nr:hypothetical protein HGM15179_001323 [Zosterops borbonicus]
MCVPADNEIDLMAFLIQDDEHLPILLKSSGQIEKVTDFWQPEVSDFLPFAGCIDVVESAVALVHDSSLKADKTTPPHVHQRLYEIADS